MKRLLLVLFLGIWCWSATAAPAATNTATVAPLADAERLELEIFRKRVPAMKEQLQQYESAAVSPDELRARSAYIQTYYTQQARLAQMQVRVFEWQLFASNVVLFLVAALALSGIGFSGYQLWMGSRIRKGVGHTTDLEISAQRVRLQTSVVGLVVLVISAVFLLLFLREVYKVVPVDLSSPPLRSIPK